MKWKELPAKLKTYIILLVSAATPILIFSIIDVSKNNYDSGWIILAILTILTVPPFLVVFPSVSTIALIGDAYVMSIAMLYGCSPCIVATACHSTAASLLARNKQKKEFYRLAFNVSSTVFCAWAYSNVYRFLNPSYSKHAADIALPIVALTITFFVLNSLLTAAAICFLSKQSIFKFWIQNYFTLGVEFSLSSVSAALIVTLYQFGRWVPIVVAPIIGILWGWNRINKAKALEAEKHLSEQEELYLRTVESLAIAVEVKDQTTYGHIRRVKVYANELARLCGIKDPDVLKAIQTGALLHDIGKLAIDDYILNKPGRLSKQEFEKIKMHVQAGEEILRQIRFPFPVADYVRCHHERWDGLGYPNGLKGEEIPLGGRILAIADAFDAIRYSRPYKLPIHISEAVEILRSQSGTVYDSNLVRLFIDNIDEIEKAAIRESENTPELSFRQSLKTADQAILQSNVSANNATPHDFSAEMIRFAEFCSSATGYLEFEDILPIVARRIESLIPFSACVVCIDDGNGGVKAEYATGCFNEEFEGRSIEMGKGIGGWVAAHGRPMINTEPVLDFQDLKIDCSILKDVLAAPILLGDDCLGALCLYGKNPLSFNHVDLDVLQAIAGFAAPMIAEIRNRKNLKSDDFVDPATQLRRISYLAVLGPHLFSSARKDGSPVSLIYLEIKNLYRVFKEYGADAGNSLLRKIADCIKPELRETDILVRYGNRAFIALLPGVRDDLALRCAQRLKKTIKSQRFNLGERLLSIECAIGFSSYPKNGSTIFALLQSAQKTTGARTGGAGRKTNKVVGFSPRLF